MGPNQVSNLVARPISLAFQGIPSRFQRFPLFPGQNEMDQIQKIHNVLGTPSPELLASKFKRCLGSANATGFHAPGLFLKLISSRHRLVSCLLWPKSSEILGLIDPLIRNASHMDFNFPEKKGTGIERLIPHAEPECVELLQKLLKYDPDERILARQALRDGYFRELHEMKKEPQGMMPGRSREQWPPGFS